MIKLTMFFLRSQAAVVEIGITLYGFFATEYLFPVTSSSILSEFPFLSSSGRALSRTSNDTVVVTAVVAAQILGHWV